MKNILKKVNILAFGAHPDDIDVGCGGTLLKENLKGKEVGLVDLTAGDRGASTPEVRIKESLKSAEIIKPQFRVNLRMPDTKLKVEDKSIQKVQNIITVSDPEVILTPLKRDIHPDHITTSLIVEKAIFEAKLEGYSPRLLLYYLIDYYQKADIIIDITDQWESKERVLIAHSSQFNQSEIDLYTNKPFAQILGMQIGKKYGEGFISTTPFEVESLLVLRNNLLFEGM